ncbi:DUF397 domain-containing protein [Nocardia sp. 2]|uniref:DUF397 domain-containing protein n=1 Tax=Nocardia acididurans TaxID=2802282 RepID=A0ABS1M788_9NOCA|nr:DUF397 domain-containing protein [Nocardia acididurans]MBL1076161.1 DUF397 domain-containing protein [Nocardia acididurans]
MRKPIRGEWYKSSRSEGAKQCVEVYHGNDSTGIRDSKHPGGPELYFTPAQWGSFLRFLSAAE